MTSMKEKDKHLFNGEIYDDNDSWRFLCSTEASIVEMQIKLREYLISLTIID